MVALLGMLDTRGSRDLGVTVGQEMYDGVLFLYGGGSLVGRSAIV